MRDSKGRFVKGNVHSQETLDKMSKSKNGTMCGENNPFYGKTHIPEVRERLSRINKGKVGIWRGKKFSEEIKKKMSDSHKGIPNNWDGRKHSEESRIKMSLTKKKMFEDVKEREKISKSVKKLWKNKEYRDKMIGKNSSNWRGGLTSKTKLKRLSSMWKQWREDVFDRDDYTCQANKCPHCGNKIGGKLHPHHKKPVALYEELIFDVDNGITYCVEYHMKSGLHKGIQKKFQER